MLTNEAIEVHLSHLRPAVEALGDKLDAVSKKIDDGLDAVNKKLDMASWRNSTTNWTR